MDKKIKEILTALDFRVPIGGITQFCAEEDGSPYNVWKLDTEWGSLVLKKTTPGEREVYDTFFPHGGPVPKNHAFGEYEGNLYMLMEYVQGTSMSRCNRQQLQLALDALIASQERYWNDTAHAEAGYSFEKSYPGRRKRLAYMGDLTDAYQAYLDAFAAVPRTLCNDDLLPFNVLVSEEKAVIIDWEYAGILPYPCAIARLLAFGEDNPGALFQMTAADRQFALDYYYENLIKDKSISRSEYDRTIQLFFLKEYSEWVYCAGISGDYEMAHYKKYYAKARQLAQDLGVYIYNSHSYKIP
ncbi:MAG: aminoglycoside phosphotransferase family protein [Lachnospiraceae bacterium]